MKIGEALSGAAFNTATKPDASTDTQIRILVLGDVIKPQGAKYVASKLREIRKAENADVAIVNAENTGRHNEFDPECAELLLSSGADILTGGNHSLRSKNIQKFFEEHKYAIRPLNYPPLCPGNGYVTARLKTGLKLLVINVAGQVFMDPADSPFYATERVLKSVDHDICVVDFHGEATSEKAAFARYFDGRVHVTFGTHTHVPTADEQILPLGSGFITDVGMCGVENSIIGMNSETVIDRYIRKTNNYAELPDETPSIMGAVFTFSMKHKRVIDVKRIKY